MIDKNLVEQTVLAAIEDTDLFLVDLRIEPGNRIVVEIEAAEGSVDVEQCAAISRRIEDVLDRDADDFELEVGSAGLTSPFKVRGQYIKNIGNDIEVLTRTGKKLKGRLEKVADDSFTLVVTAKEKPEGAKRPVTVEHSIDIPFTDVKKAVYLIDFK